MGALIRQMTGFVRQVADVRPVGNGSSSGRLPVFGRFTDEDEQGLRQLVAQLEKVLATTDYKKFFASVAG